MTLILTTEFRMDNLYFEVFILYLSKENALLNNSGSFQLDLTNLIEKDMKRMTENQSSCTFLFSLYADTECNIGHSIMAKFSSNSSWKIKTEN